jgi:hypothetical protein
MPPHWRILSGAANGANLPTKTDKGGDALDFNVCHQFGRLFRNQRRATAPLLIENAGGACRSRIKAPNATMMRHLRISCYVFGRGKNSLSRLAHPGPTI